MNKFIVLAAIVACAYGVPVQEVEGEREGRDVFVVQQFPGAPIIPQAAPAEQDPLFVTKPNGVAVSLVPSFNLSSLFPSSNSNGGYFIARDQAAYPYPYFPQAAPAEQDPLFVTKPNGVAVSLVPSFNFSSLFPSSSSNGGYYIARDQAAYPYPYYPQAIHPYPLFRHAPIPQPFLLVPVEQPQAAPVPAETNADAAAAPAEQIQGRLFSLQVPSDLSSVSVTKPTLLSLANSGSSGIVAGITGLSGISTSATLAALSGSKNVAIDSNGNLYISG